MALSRAVIALDTRWCILRKRNQTRMASAWASAASASLPAPLPAEVSAALPAIALIVHVVSVQV
jgi:hypothetical protein